MYRALLFDLDGTLAETDSLHLPTWADVLGPRGIQVDEGFYRENISGRSNREIVRDLLPGVSDEEGRSIELTKEAAFRDLVRDLKPLAGVAGFLDGVKRRDLKTALVTNAPGENAGAVLRILGLQDFFDSVVLSEDVGAGKPDPAPYRAALKKVGVAPAEAVAFEDSVSGIASSIGAGIPTVGVASTQDPERLRGAGAFVVVEDFNDPTLLGLIRA